MKKARITISWPEGLHLRHAAQVAREAQALHSAVRLRLRDRVSDARSVVGLLLLCATLGSVVDLEVSGEDEDLALATLTSVFAASD